MLPIYNLIDGEVDKMSLVLNPAVELGFMCFSKQDPVKMKFDDIHNSITGVAILSDTPIYRYNEKFGEHYVVFPKELVERLVLKFFKEHKNSEVNIDHEKDASNIVIYESYLTSPRVQSNLFPDVPEGSWIVTYKVLNSDVYEKIKSGKLQGFSIEGYFQYPSEPEDSMENLINKLI